MRLDIAAYGGRFVTILYTFMGESEAVNHLMPYVRQTVKHVPPA